jgi:serine/threonine protein kinase
MEYVDGRSLSQIQKKCLEKGILIPVEYCAYVIAELCHGLDYMHRRKDESGQDLKIVHRDISPQNIIVSYSGNVKIVDFGVAKAAFKLGEEQTGILKGKFAYMSPEQAEGIEIDSRSDLFSAGTVLWELLTSQRLFKKKTNIETVEAVKKMAVVPPSQYRPDIPSDLEEILSKSLEKDPILRYPTAHDMSLDLTKFLLKHSPDFKPSNLSHFLSQIFDREEEVTGDIHFEKTLKEDATLLEYSRSLSDPTVKSLSSPELKAPEITQVVNPEEIDFRSIFEEISWEDESDSGGPPRGGKKQPATVLSNYDDLSVTHILPDIVAPKKKMAGWLRPALFLLFFAFLLALLIYALK